MAVLVTGGAGYIGSHTVELLDEKGYEAVVLDNLCRAHKKSLDEKIDFENINLLDNPKLRRLFQQYDIEAVIHFSDFVKSGGLLVCKALTNR